MNIVCRAVLFDSDGVLVDSHRDGRRAWDQLAIEFDFELDDDAFASIAGIRTVDSLARLVHASQLSHAVDRLEDLEVELADPTPVLSGARDLVASIPSDRWAIATSASLRLGMARWAGAAIPVPPVVISAEDVINGKPDPEPYLVAARRLGVGITDCLVVEDSPSGGQAGIAAGAQVLAVGDQVWSVEPTCRVRDLSEVRCTLADDALSIEVESER